MALTPYPSLATLPEVIANGGKLPTRMIDAFAARTVYASSIAGVRLDCNLDTGAKIGGGTATDNAALLNAYLATATAASPVHLIIDGPSALGSPLIIPATGYVSISGLGWGTGFFVKSGANSAAIQNFPATDLAEYQVWSPGGPQAITGSNVSLSNFRVNGNRGTYPNGNSNGIPDGTINGTNAPGANGSGPDVRGPFAVAGYWLSGIILRGIDRLDMDRLWVYDAPAYHINLYHCTNFTITRCRVESATPDDAKNKDGIHINGGCYHFRIDGCYVASGDDSFALNFAEGDGTGGGDGLVTNCEVRSITLGRCYGYYTAESRRITFSNITGSVRFWGLLVGQGGGGSDTGADTNHHVVVDNVWLNVIGESFVDNAALVQVGANAGVVDVRNSGYVEPTIAIPVVRMVNAPGIASVVRMTGCGIHRSASGNAAAYAFDGTLAGSRVNKLVIQDFLVTEQDGQNYPDIPILVKCGGTSFGDIVLDANVEGVGKVLDVTTASTVGGKVHVKNLIHRSNAGSPAASSIAIATSSGTVPVIVDAYDATNVAGVASGAVRLTGPGLVSSGFTFADSLIADGTIFPSSDQSALCYKLAGSSTPIAMGTASAATAYTVTGPVSGTPGSASTNFTVTPNGFYSGTITITPSGGGLSTPIVKSFSASAPQTFTITPTSSGAVTLTCTNSGTLTNQAPLTYTATAGAVTYVDDTFTGSAGATIAGSTPSPKPSGSDTWSDFSGSGFGVMGFVGGAAAGARATAMGNGTVFAQIAMTAAPTDHTVTFRFRNASAGAQVNVQVGRAGGENHQIAINYGAGQVTLSRQSGAAPVVVATKPTGVVIGTEYTMTAKIYGSLMDISIGGTLLFNAQAITPTGGTAVIIGQQGGFAGDVVFTEVKVSSN